MKNTKKIFFAALAISLFVLLVESTTTVLRIWKTYDSTTASLVDPSCQADLDSVLLLCRDCHARGVADQEYGASRVTETETRHLMAGR